MIGLALVVLVALAGALYLGCYLTTESCTGRKSSSGAARPSMTSTPSSRRARSPTSRRRCRSIRRARRRRSSIGSTSCAFPIARAFGADRRSHCLYWHACADRPQGSPALLRSLCERRPSRGGDFVVLDRQVCALGADRRRNRRGQDRRTRRADHRALARAGRTTGRRAHPHPPSPVDDVGPALQRRRLRRRPARRRRAVLLRA